MAAESTAAAAAGAARRRRAQGVKAEKLQTALLELDPRLGAWADDFVFGQVWADDVLAHDERMLVAIAALAATGRSNQLRNYLHGALQDGIAPARIREVLRMMVVYAGFPLAIESLVELQAALDARGGSS
jgi:4-carboxymuconolactone decarboxylase